MLEAPGLSSKLPSPKLQDHPHGAGGSAGSLACRGADNRWLLFSQHCYTSEKTEEQCHLGKLCTYGKQTLVHVANCPAGAACPFPRCGMLKAAPAARLCWHCRLTVPVSAGPASADEQRASLLKAPTSADASQTIYFGNGCFWGRQKDFIETEKALGRTPDSVSALVGYAGGVRSGPGDKVCYYYSDPRTVYEKLGHAEVVQVAVSTDASAAEREFRAFAKTYFGQFKKTPFGMIRSDPQDVGPGYRNVIGIPSGVASPLFKVLQAENVNGMALLPGSGNDFVDGKPTENDLINTVWVVDSSARPFYRAERYHQFHNGLGKTFPASYVKDLKDVAAKRGLIDPTGCPELPF